MTFLAQRSVIAADPAYKQAKDQLAAAGDNVEARIKAEMALLKAERACCDQVIASARGTGRGGSRRASARGGNGAAAPQVPGAPSAAMLDLAKTVGDKIGGMSPEDVIARGYVGAGGIDIEALARDHPAVADQLRTAPAPSAPVPGAPVAATPVPGAPAGPEAAPVADAPAVVHANNGAPALSGLRSKGSTPVGATGPNGFDVAANGNPAVQPGGAAPRKVLPSTEVATVTAPGGPSVGGGLSRG